MAKPNKKTALVPRTAARKASFVDAVGSGKKTGTELAPREDDAIDVPTTSRQYTSTPQFDRTEIQMPKLKLGQGMTPEVQDKLADMGQWLVTGFDPEDTVQIIPMVFARGRVRNEDDAIVCSSNDAITGVGDPGGNCHTCPHAQWGKPKKNSSKGTPPECTFYYSYGVWSITHQEMMTLDMKKTAINAARLINTLIQKNGMGTFAIELGSQLTKGPQGSFAIPTVKQIKLSDKELAVAQERFSFGM